MNTRLALQRIALVIAILCGVLLIAPLAEAQAAGTASWTQTNVASAAGAQALTFRIYVTPAGGATPITGVLLTTVVCTGAVAPFACSAALPVGTEGALLTGSKTELTAQLTGTAESTKSVPFLSPAAVPTAVRVTP